MEEKKTYHTPTGAFLAKAAEQMRKDEEAHAERLEKQRKFVEEKRRQSSEGGVPDEKNPL